MFFDVPKVSIIIYSPRMTLYQAMKKERKDSQTTVKMSPSLRKRIDEAAEQLGISSMEYIRRACEEKLARGTLSKEDEIKEIVLRTLEEKCVSCIQKEEEIRRIVLSILEEKGVAYRK